MRILASPGYAPGTIAVNVTWMERGFIAGQKHSSIYLSIFNANHAYYADCGRPFFFWGGGNS